MAGVAQGKEFVTIVRISIPSDSIRSHLRPIGIAGTTPAVFQTTTDRSTCHASQEVKTRLDPDSRRPRR